VFPFMYYIVTHATNDTERSRCFRNDLYLIKVEVDSATSVTILPVAEKVPAVGS
jgi:hypothetical protein